MKGSARGRRERTIVLAHQIEAMARQKRLKPVEQYLRQKKRARGTDGRAVIDMLKRKGVKVEPIQAPASADE